MKSSNIYPLVSIILPTHNGAKYLAESINSCLFQTYTNIELIIIDDGSTDNSINIINSFIKKDNRVKVFSNNKKTNLPKALNIGHRNAIGKLITWTSDDNRFKENAISVLVEKLIKNNVDIVYSNYEIINTKGTYVKSNSVSFIQDIFYGNCIGPCFLYRLNVFKYNNGYREDLFLVEDYYYWLNSSNKFSFYKIEENLYEYREHKISLTSKIKSENNYYKIWKNNLHKAYKIYFGTISKSELDFLIRLNNRQDNYIDSDIYTFLKFINRVSCKYKKHFVQEPYFITQLNKIYRNIVMKKKKYFIFELFYFIKYFNIFYKITQYGLRKKIIKKYLHIL